MQMGGGLTGRDVADYQMSRPSKTMLTTSQANKPTAMKFSRLIVMLMVPDNGPAARPGNGSVRDCGEIRAGFLQRPDDSLRIHVEADAVADVQPVDDFAALNGNGHDSSEIGPNRHAQGRPVDGVDRSVEHGGGEFCFEIDRPGLRSGLRKRRTSRFLRRRGGHASQRTSDEQQACRSQQSARHRA